MESRGESRGNGGSPLDNDQLRAHLIRARIRELDELESRMSKITDCCYKLVAAAEDAVTQLREEKQHAFELTARFGGLTGPLPPTSFPVAFEECCKRL